MMRPHPGQGTRRPSPSEAYWGLFNTRKEEIMEQGRRANKASFYRHLIIYCVVNVFLFILNTSTTPDHLWFYWPLLGWGIGLSMHALSAFGPSGLSGGTDE